MDEKRTRVRTQNVKIKNRENPSHRSLLFLLHDYLHGFNELFTNTSDHIRFLLFSLSLFHFLVFRSVR